MDGFAENQSTTITGPVVKLFWYATDGRMQSAEITFDSPGVDPDSGPVQVPFHLEQTLDFTSLMVGFQFEGTGPGDNLDFTGTFTYSQIPEPSSLFLLAMATLGLSFYRRRRRAF